MKILLSGFLLSSSSSDCWHVFLMGMVQTLQGAAMSHWPSLKRPRQIRSRQGEVGHRGRSYQRAAECEGQKSWCIQAHHTVTRHSSAQGPSEQAALTFKSWTVQLGVYPSESTHVETPLCEKKKKTSGEQKGAQQCGARDWLNNDRFKNSPMRHEERPRGGPIISTIESFIRWTNQNLFSLISIEYLCRSNWVYILICS